MRRQAITLSSYPQEENVLERRLKLGVWVIGMEVHRMAAGRHILGMVAIERVKKSKALEKENVDSGYYLKEIEKKKEKIAPFWVFTQKGEWVGPTEP